jgi:hypothetical protein
MREGVIFLLGVGFWGEGGAGFLGEMIGLGVFDATDGHPI